MITKAENTTGTITNGCSCQSYNEARNEYEDSSECFGDCWEFQVEDFAHVTEQLRKNNPNNYWKVSDLNLWNRNVSGSFYAEKVSDLLRGMTVNSEWTMRYEIFDDHVEYSLSHHDSMGGKTVLSYANNEGIIRAQQAQQLLKDARQRGYDRGLADKKESIYRNDILSGEWAGESITEILGDLLDGYDEMQQDWVCDEYVMGYEEANEPDEKCPICEETWCDSSCEDDEETE